MTDNRTRLIQARERLGLSIGEMAIVMGVSPYTIRNWEVGTRAVSSCGARLLDVLDILQILAPMVLDTMVRDAKAADQPCLD